MILRPYQQELVSKAEEALKSRGNTLAVAATGAGKTVMLSALAGRIGGRQLVLQHRQELVRQNAKKFRQMNDAEVSFWTAKTKSFSGSTTFAMVQSLYGHLDSMPKLDLIIADEAHHVAANTWLAIIQEAKKKNPDVMVAGFTATPMRSDARSLRSVFDNVCGVVDTRKLVDMGFLVRPRTLLVDVPGVSEGLSSLGSQSAFGEQVQVAEVLNTVPVNAEVVKHWKEHAEGRKTIVFCSTVDHAEDVAAAFRDAGISACSINGSMSDTLRKESLKGFAEGEYQVCTNVAVLTEGYDYPPISCVILLRQCSDKGPLLQMIGRGLRTVNPEEFPGVIKRDCIVMDFGTSLATHGAGLFEIPRVVQDGENREKAEASPTKVCPACGMEIDSKLLICPVCGFDFTPEEEAVEQPETVRMTEVDLLAASPFRYCDIFGSGRVLIANGFEAWAGIFSPNGDDWYALGKVSRGRVRTLLIGERVQCMSAADDFLREHETDNSAGKKKRWLNDLATENQLKWLANFGYDTAFPWSKYEAACHMSFQFARHSIEKAIGVA